MKNEMILQLEDYYLSRLGTGTNSSEKLGWESQDAHYARFRNFTAAVDCEYKDVLDLGAGLGDLYQHFMDEGIICRYTGVDILDHMVHRASMRFPGVEFLCLDLLANSGVLGRTFDIVFSAGIFNLKAYSGIDFLKRSFVSMLDLARQNVVISLLHKDAPFREPETYCYFDPAEIISILAVPGWELECLDGYLRNDFTLLATRKVL